MPQPGMSDFVNSPKKALRLLRSGWRLRRGKRETGVEMENEKKLIIKE